MLNPALHSTVPRVNRVALDAEGAGTEAGISAIAGRAEIKIRSDGEVVSAG
jgi:hypothetical protein